MPTWAEEMQQIAHENAEWGRFINRCVGLEERPVRGFGVTSEKEARFQAEEQEDER
jgi:hypothetical protein